MDQIMSWLAPILSALVVCAGQLFLNDQFKHADEKREAAREQHEAERVIILAMSRTMLLNNYEKCMAKGYYTLEEREVYHKLYEAYREDNGNGIIEEIAPRIRALPMEPPKNDRS